MSPLLPDDLVRALALLSEGVSRTALAERAARISERYRNGGSSSVIATTDDALAYALARMPATYAAVAAALGALQSARPEFAPERMIDVGAGPASATWAAAVAFPSIARFALVDSNTELRALALDLVRGNDRLRRCDYRLGTARAFLNGAGDADLVVASYLVGECDEAELAGLADLLWQRARDVLVIVEPGTPAGYRRIIAVRRQLLATGAAVVAPCPHDNECPLQSPDWCHFAQRLPRSRDHKLLKKADVPFEDEKFSYVVLSRTPLASRSARVIAEPSHSRAGLTAKLCMAEGVSSIAVQRRDRNAYAGARRWRWGDAVQPAKT